MIVKNLPMRADSGFHHASFVRLAWAGAVRWVTDEVVHLVRILGESALKFFERPNCLTFGVDGLADLPHVHNQLRIALEVMQELRVGGSEEPS